MTTQQFITKAESTFQNQTLSIKNLEIQVGQTANILNTKPQGALPSITESNPKGREQVNIVTLRNGRQIEEPNEKSTTNVQVQIKGKVTNPQPFEENGEKYASSPIKPYIPSIPFSQRLKKHNDDKQFAKFLDIFK